MEIYAPNVSSDASSIDGMDWFRRFTDDTIVEKIKSLSQKVRLIWDSSETGKGDILGTFYFIDKTR